MSEERQEQGSAQTEPEQDGLVEGDGERFDGLLQGQEAWWHFLGAKASDEPTAEAERGMHSLELQVVGRYATQRQAAVRARFQPSHLIGMRCQSCQAMIPADLTFCVYCGGEPGYKGGLRAQTMIIHDIEDPDVFSEVVELVIRSNAKLNAREVWSALAQPPAVFFFEGHDEHAKALIDRFGELGVNATVTRHERATQFSMPKEIFESILRHRPSLVAWLSWLALSAILIGLLPSVWFGIVISAALSVALWRRQQTMFSDRYEIDVIQILNAMTGFDPELIKLCVRALSGIERDASRALLTQCLIEYYGIWRHLASAPPAMRRVVAGLKESLDELTQQIVEVCLHYAQLEHYLSTHQVSALEETIAQLDAKLLETEEAEQRRYISHELEQRHSQIHTARQCEELLPAFERQLVAMCASLEALRARIVSMKFAQPASGADEPSLSQILAELDQELSVFEHTIEEVALASQRA